MLPFFTELARVLATVDERTFHHACDTASQVRRQEGRVYFIGNGGSAAIASHMAIDWMNKGKFRAYDLNNPAALTCLANDYGFTDVFSRQLDDMVHCDLLMAISSSGKSPNILKAAKKAREEEALIITLSGFDADNPLRQFGTNGADIYVPSDNYAIVENAHLAILHGMLESLKG